MKKAISLFLIFCCIVSLCGCSNIHLKDRMIIQGIAIDTCGEGFRITVQDYKSSTGGDSGSKFELYTSTGTTLYEATQNITYISGKQPFYSDALIAVLSYSAIKKDFSGILDFLIRNNEIRDNILLLCTSCDPAKIISFTKGSQTMPSERMVEIIKTDGGDKSYGQSELYDVVNRLSDVGSDVCLPCATPIYSKDETSIYISGYLCFRDFTPIGMLSKENAEAFKWINGYSKNATLVVEQDNIPFTFSLTSISPEIKCTGLENSHAVFDIKLTIECGLSQISRNSLKTFDIGILTPLKKAVEKKVTSMMRSTVFHSFFTMKSDAFRLGKYAKKYQPEYYKSISDWHNEMSNCKINCSADVNINRIEQENNPR